jgi:hypothetical protein
VNGLRHADSEFFRQREFREFSFLLYVSRFSIKGGSAIMKPMTREESVVRKLQPCARSGLCLLFAMLLGFPAGCDKGLPKVQDLIGQGDKEKENAPAANAPPKQPGQKTEQKPAEKVARAPEKPKPPVEKPKPVPSADPEKVIARFNEDGAKIREDADIESLIARLGDRTDLVTQLDLSSSNVTETGMMLLPQFPNLIDLNLKATHFNPPGWEPLAKLSNLEVLNIAETLITNGDLQHLSSLTKMKELYIDKCPKIGEVGFAQTFMGYTELEILSLNGNQSLDGRGFAEIRKRKGFPNLRVVAASKSKFGTLGLASCTGLKSLETLELGDADVGSRAMAGLKGCVNLKRVLLGFNGHLNDLGLVVFKRAKQLEYLDLHNCKAITDNGIRSLSNCHKLQLLNLDGTKATNKMAEAIQKKFPDVEIIIAGRKFQPSTGRKRSRR